MKENKFRVFCNKTKKYFYYDNLEEIFDEGFYACEIDEYRQLDGYTPFLDDYDIEKDKRPDNDYIVMQYIGLKDKNNKEIYEGDIVKAIYKENKEDIYVGVIKFDELCWKLGTFELFMMLGKYDIEIIGNIHENPELLEVE